MEIKKASSLEDIQKCKEVILCLRPHLESENLETLLLEMFGEGYELAFIEENEKAIAMIGYRYLRFLYNGKHIYIDDLSTLPEARGKGCGAALLEFVAAEAKAKGYKVVTLDSGVTAQRVDAHRLYFNQGFYISSLHFSKNID